MSDVTDEQCDAIIEALDEIARAMDPYGLGLPTCTETRMADMRDAVLAALATANKGDE